MPVSQAHGVIMDCDEAGAYAKFGPPGATDQKYLYGNLKVFKYIGAYSL